MADYDKVFTERESKTLLNKCSLNYDMGHFSFKPRLFFCKDNIKMQPVAMDCSTENMLLGVISKHQPLNNSLCFKFLKNDTPTGHYPNISVYEILRNIPTNPFDCALTHRNNYYVELGKLMITMGGTIADAVKLKSSRFYEAIVTFMVAATHYDSLVPHLKWLCSTDFDKDYNTVVNMSHMENVLNTKSNEFFNIITSAPELLISTLHDATHYTSDLYSELGAGIYGKVIEQGALETVVFGIEILNRIESIKDSDLRDCIYQTFKTPTENPIVRLMYTIDTTGVHIQPEVQKIIDISDMEQRYYAIREFVNSHSLEISKYANMYIADIDNCVNPMFNELIKFCQNESIMSIRLKTVFILYNYVKKHGWLSELSFEDGDLGIPIPGCPGSLTASEAEVPETFSMMDFDYAKHDLDAEPPKPEPKSSAHKSDVGISFEELDRLDADFKSSKYDFKVETVESMNSASADRYNAVATKMDLLNKSLIRSIKDIKVYNTGGKNIGKKTGKLDRKNLYKYKTSKDIFFDNTYKVKESDLAFGIILDVSGSMHGDGIENGIATMIVLHETLKALNINHSIITHTSKGHHQSTIKRYQLFREDKHYKCTKNYALAEIRARGGNCDSGALYYMEQCMRRVKNKDKICIMFSDGEPTECTDTELKDQVRHMEQNGIKVIGVGIDFPSIKEYYSNNANGRNLKEMFNIVSDILKQYVLEKVDKE